MKSVTIRFDEFDTTDDMNSFLRDVRGMLNGLASTYQLVEP